MNDSSLYDVKRLHKESWLKKNTDHNTIDINKIRLHYCAFFSSKYSSLNMFYNSKVNETNITIDYIKNV